MLLLLLDLDSTNVRQVWTRVLFLEDLRVLLYLNIRAFRLLRQHQCISNFAGIDDASKILFRRSDVSTNLFALWLRLILASSLVRLILDAFAIFVKWKCLIWFFFIRKEKGDERKEDDKRSEVEDEIWETGYERERRKKEANGEEG